MCISSALLALVDADKQNYNAVMGLLWLISVVGSYELSHIENSYSVMSISWFDMFSFAASVLTTVTAAFESPGRASTEGLILG